MKYSPRKAFEATKSVVRYILRPETIAASVVAVTVIAVSINTSDVILQNYRLERDVRVMQQKVALAKLELSTERLKNEYYATDYYTDIAARKLLSKGSPGEKLVIVPREVALREFPNLSQEPEVATTPDDRTNFEKWLDFLGGEL